MNLIAFIKSFLARKGQFVLLSVFLAKAVNFLITIFVIRILSKSDYGFVAYSLTIISFVAPFVGAGVHQGLLRYGALTKGQFHKKVLFGLTFWKGLKYSGFIALAILILSPLFTIRMSGSGLYLALMSLQIISLFIFQMIQVYCRLIYRNKIFAIINIQNSLLLLIFNVLMCLLFGGLGYVISIICVPLILGLFYLKRLRLIGINYDHPFVKKVRNSFTFKFKELVSYGLYMSAGGILSQLLYAVDILLIGNLLIDSEMVAQYKASSIIPFSLIILAVAVLTTDFVKLANASKNNRSELKQYYLNYLKIFSFISLGIVLFFYLFAEPILSIFGNDYKGHADLMVVFSIGVAGGLLFRVPMGNMLSAIGWPKINAIFSIIILFINVIANYFMILKYGILGAAITTSALMWLSGFLSLGAFIYYLKLKD